MNSVVTAFVVDYVSGMTAMSMRIFRLLALSVAIVCSLIPLSARGESPFPTFVPCFERDLPPMKMLPSNIPMIMVIGHKFRMADKCAPVTITFTWTNNYDRKDGYTYYNLKYSHRFSGELWYSTDHEEFAVVGDPAHWAGYDQILSIDGAGQYCAYLDDRGACHDLRKFDRGQVIALKTGGVYLGSLTYGYPEVVTNGETVPVTFFAQSPEFAFKNLQSKWQPDGGLIEVNNPALIDIDYRALVEAASDEKVYTVTVPYQNDNDVGDMPSHHAGNLAIKLDFDILCNGDDQSGMSKCEQIESLLPELKWAIELRDAYRELLPQASDDEQLHNLVKAQIIRNHPYLTDDELSALNNVFGKTRTDTLEIEVPDLCNKCTARPLCEWRTKAIKVHEETNRSYLELNQRDRDMLNIDRGRVVDSNAVDREQARIVSEIEYRAYNERAKFLLNLIEQQVGEASDCPFSAEFEEELKSWADKIDMDVTLQAPPPPPGAPHP